MNPRSYSILAYKPKDKNIMFCRACLGEEARTGNYIVIFRGRKLCELYHGRHDCCARGNRHGCSTQDFSFDNTKDEIILSTNICKLCVSCNQQNQLCETAKYFIDSYLTNIKYVGIKNISNRVTSL